MQQKVPSPTDILVDEMKSLGALVEAAKKEQDDQYKTLKAGFDGAKSTSDETRAAVTKLTEQYATASATVQALQASLDMVKKQLDAPVHRGGSDLKDADRKIAEAIQLERHKYTNSGDDAGFRVDGDKLVNVGDLRSALSRLARSGATESKKEAMNRLTDAQRHALDAASIDSAFFVPQLLGYELDCQIECATLLDVYGQVSVQRSRFMYPAVEKYEQIGSYECPANCDANLGDPGNIRMVNGQTYDWRGVFCFQKDALKEASYDLLGFMMMAAERSYRINRNRATMTGDGINQPLGWLTADKYKKLKTEQRGGTPKPSFNHIDFRRFLGVIPTEYGPIKAVMHQNVFGYLAAQTDSTGRFIFGDGQIDFTPDRVRDTIRISNCLPDATEGGTLAGADLVPGTFLAAAGNWNMAYKVFNHQAMIMEQWIGGSSLWCSKYQFGAKDGGQVHCAEAARVLVVG